MFGASHHMPLHAAHQRGAERAEMEGIFSVGFLRASPSRVAQQVDADAAEIVAAEGAQFPPDHVADALLELRIKGGAARHRDGKGGRAFHDDAARAIGEPDAGNAEARDFAGLPDLRAVAARSGHRGEAGPNR